ncbi:LPXTG-motif cell wall-anchored protein [Nocardiopsis sp. Huas11]|uniref:LPXTG cell wall anchor domain-containing protein n=1 Tax=Nocardiopsis sp. Huas11 TaxID=2183912 RepID=UPI000F1049DF|nr:LPXTG cell wall anchor domain-containing protein [Nocardiopsis sp. Huas11]RKS04500.1 LPXTG-motif cell wall-anchored protein [Nocardiopsis sp. Huas11]
MKHDRGGVSAAGGDREGEVLAQTGSSVAVPAVGGLVSVITGAVAMVLGRRRTETEE